MAEKQDYQYDMPQTQNACGYVSDGHQSPYNVSQRQLLYDGTTERHNNYLLQSSNSYPYAGSTGAQQINHRQEERSTEGAVREMPPPSPGSANPQYITIHSGEPFSNGQPGMFIQAQEPHQTPYLPQQMWSVNDGVQDVVPQASASADAPYVVVQPGPSQSTDHSPSYYHSPTEEQGLQLSTYTQPTQDSVAQHIVISPPVNTIMRHIVAHPGPIRNRGPPAILLRMPQSARNPAPLMLNRTRCYGPFQIYLVCPYCAQHIRTEVRMIQDVNTWNHYVLRAYRNIGSHHLSWRIHAYDVEHRCPRCKGYLGTFIRNPNNWGRY